MAVPPRNEDNQINQGPYFPKLPIYNPDEIHPPSFDNEGFKATLEKARDGRTIVKHIVGAIPVGME